MKSAKNHTQGGSFIALLALTFFTLATPSLMALDCTNADITLSSQADVDAFQINHGPCNTVIKNLIVQGNDIANLDGLAGITTFWAEVLITENPSLTSTAGLSNVADWGSSLEISKNPILDNLVCLSGLSAIPGSLRIQDNDSLLPI